MSLGSGTVMSRGGGEVIGHGAVMYRALGKTGHSRCGRNGQRGDVRRL